MNSAIAQDAQNLQLLLFTPIKYCVRVLKFVILTSHHNPFQDHCFSLL